MYLENIIKEHPFFEKECKICGKEQVFYFIGEQYGINGKYAFDCYNCIECEGTIAKNKYEE